MTSDPLTPRAAGGGVMTDSEIRQRLAEAMGWMDLRAGAVRTLSGVLPAQNILVRTEVPDPLESDRDAALLRAWCLEQGWNVELNCYPDLAVVSIYSADDEFLAQAWVGAIADFADLSTIQRERLAMGRAVVRAIDAGGAASGG